MSPLAQVVLDEEANAYYEGDIPEPQQPAKPYVPHVDMAWRAGIPALCQQPAWTN